MKYWINGLFSDFYETKEISELYGIPENRDPGP